MRTFLSPIWLTLLMTLFASSAFAQSPKDAQAHLETQHKQVKKLLAKKASADRNSKLDAMLDQLLDYETLAQKSLSKEWDKRSATEQGEFSELLKKLIRKNYRENLTQTIDFKIKYTEAEAKDGGAFVRSVARSATNRRAPAVSIDYAMMQKNGQWRVVDVITDEVSLVKNYRRQFRRIIKKEGWDGLMKKMQNKLGE